MELLEKAIISQGYLDEYVKKKVTARKNQNQFKKVQVKSSEVTDIINRNSDRYERAIFEDALIKSSNRNEVLMGCQTDLYNVDRISPGKNIRYLPTHLANKIRN